MQIVFEDNVMYGATLRFGPSLEGVTHVVNRNLFMGSTSGALCDNDATVTRQRQRQ